MKRNLCLFFLIICFGFQGIAQHASQYYLKPEYIHAVLKKTATWQLGNPQRRARNDWTNAVFYAGLFAAWESTQSQPLYDSLMVMGNTVH